MRPAVVKWLPRATASLIGMHVAATCAIGLHVAKLFVTPACCSRACCGNLAQFIVICYMLTFFCLYSFFACRYRIVKFSSAGCGAIECITDMVILVVCPVAIFVICPMNI